MKMYYRYLTAMIGLTITMGSVQAATHVDSVPVVDDRAVLALSVQQEPQSNSAAADDDPSAQLLIGLEHERLALDFIHKAASQGNAEAQFNLGVRYTKGCGVTKNPRLGFEWTYKAAELGYIKAQNELVYNLRRYNRSSGLRINLKQATRWLHQAAEQGDADAQYRLADWRYSGDDLDRADGGSDPYTYIQPDEQLMMMWYGKAAIQGHIDSQKKLGSIYLNKKNIYGKEDNEKLAFKWYSKAAELGDMESQEQLGQLYSVGRGTRKDINLAVAWYSEAAEQGSVTAKAALGDLFATEPNIMDTIQAIEWYCQAAEQGYGIAYTKLIEIYENGGSNVGINEERAVEWTRSAARKGHVGAQLKLGDRYAKGRGVAKNETSSVEWYYKAARQGCLASSIRERAYERIVYGDGLGINNLLDERKKLQSKAKAQLEHVAKRGNKEAMFKMGILSKPRSTRSSYDQALDIDWFHKAAEQGHIQALDELVEIVKNNDPQSLRVLDILGCMYEFGRGVESNLAQAFLYFAQCKKMEALTRITAHLCNLANPPTFALEEAFSHLDSSSFALVFADCAPLIFAALPARRAEVSECLAIFPLPLRILIINDYMGFAHFEALYHARFPENTAAD